MDLQEPLLPKHEDGKSNKLTIILVSTIITLVAIIVAIIANAISFGTVNDNIASIPLTPSILPSHYRLPVEHMPSVHDQENRGTCWAFASVAFYEERYKAQGLAKGMLDEDEYLQLSVQGHTNNAINYCTAHPEQCPDTPEASGSATDGYEDWIRMMDDYLEDRIVIDLASCPYVSDEGHDTDCDGMEEFIAMSPISYDLKSYKPLYNIQDIKRELFDTKRSIPLVTELTYQPYYVPCDEYWGMEWSSQCRFSTNLCPPDMGLEEGAYCAVSYLLTDAEGHYLSRGRSATTLGAHAMLLTGYNDEYSYMDGDAEVKGGFVVLNSWSPGMSHSMEWFNGDISIRNEQYMCPNIEAPSQWAPATGLDGEDMYKLRTTTVLECLTAADPDSKPYHFHSDSDTLKLLDEVITCKEGYQYALDHTLSGPDGTSRLVMREFLPGDSPDTGSLVTLPPFPRSVLAYKFRPVDMEGAENMADECGYYFIPYSYVEAIFARYGVFWVNSLDIEFSDASYTKGQSSDVADLIADSVRSQERIVWETHTPWHQDSSMWPRA